jgi:hypothetical protein
MRATSRSASRLGSLLALAVVAAATRPVDWKTADVATMIRTSRQEATATGTDTDTDGTVRSSVFVARHLQDIPEHHDVAGTAATTTPGSPTVRDDG